MIMNLSIKKISFSSVLLLITLGLPLLLRAQQDDVSQMQQATPPKLVLEKQNPVISPALDRFLSRCAPTDSVKIWVFFTDKGIFSQEKYQLARIDFEKTLTQSALKRRLKNRVQVDFVDLPLNQNYLDQVQRLGAKLRQSSRWLNAASIEIPSGSVEKIAQLPFVRYITKVATYQKRYPDITPFLLKYGKPTIPAAYGRNYGPSAEQLEQIRVPVVHDMGFCGQGIIVGMLDTGFFKDHQAFVAAFSESRVLAEWDFINEDENTQNEAEDSLEQHDHGTCTWSALGGEFDGQLYGPAFKSSFALAKTEKDLLEEQIEEDYWVAGLQWADSIGAEVISSSVGYLYWYTYEELDGNTAECTQAADLAASRGVLVVNAAGNERLYPWHYIITPADGDSVVAVGAVNWEGIIADFSSVGPTYDGRIKPEVVARGVNTYCALSSVTNDYGWVGGTSLSTPLVAGCAAVLLSAHPDWTAMQVREALMMTADRASDPDTVYGWGLINLFSMINYNPLGTMAILHDPPLFSPDTLNPYLIDATITPGNGLNQDSLFLYWRADTLSPFIRQHLALLGSDQYQAQIPAQSQGNIVHYYISAYDTLGYMVNLPLGAPDFKFKLFVDTENVSFDFEDGLMFWEMGGTNNRWSMISASSHGGKFCLTDSPPGKYANNTDSWAGIKNTFDLSNAISPQLSFYHKHQFGSGDTGFVEISTNASKGWETLSSFADTLEEWSQVNLLLSPYIGQTDVWLRFRLASDETDSADGWYIDDLQMNFKPTYVEEEPSSVPQQFTLEQNYPNPFNPTTVIPFRVHSSQYTVNRPLPTILHVYNIRGQWVRTLLDEEMQPGNHTVVWDGKNQDGKEVSSGIYFYQLTAGERKTTKKMLLLR
jgi:serine protease AprX